MNVNKKSLIRRVVFIIVAVAVLATIFVLSGQEKEQSYGLSDSLAKLINSLFGMSKHPLTRTSKILGLTIRNYAHIFLYILLGTSVFAAVGPTRRSWIRPLIAFAICLALAVLDEFHQLFISGRSSRSFDVLIDMIGFSLAILVYWGIAEVRRRKKDNS